MSPYEPFTMLSLHWGFSLGGISKYALSIDRAKKYGHFNIINVCIRSPRWQCDLETLESLKAVEIFIKSRSDLSWFGKLKKVIAEVQPDLIFTHGFNGHFVAFLQKITSRSSCPYICSYHGLYHPTTQLRKMLAPIFNWFTEYYIKKSLSTVAVANYTKEYLVGRGIERTRVDVIHNGIEDYQANEETVKCIREKWGVKRGELLVGVASRLDPVKGVSDLIEAYAQLVSKYPSSRLVIVGTGQEEKQLRQSVSELCLSKRVIFLGFRSDVNHCLAALDIFALPSHAEYHSIALLEAMRAGKAIVATNVGGNTESVRSGKEALIVRPKNNKELVRALDLLLASDASRQKLGLAARERYLRLFTEEVMLKRTAQWLLRCNEMARQHAQKEQHI